MVERLEPIFSPKENRCLLSNHNHWYKLKSDQSHRTYYFRAAWCARGDEAAGMVEQNVIKSVRSFVEVVWQELLSWSQFQVRIFSLWMTLMSVSKDVIYSLMVPYKYITHSLNVYTRTRVAPLTNSLCWMSFVIKPNQRLFLDILYSSLRTSSSTVSNFRKQCKKWSSQ